MDTKPDSTETVLARAVSAEVRAQMGAQRISGNQLAHLINKSQNYVATRLRDEKPFDLDDVAKIAHVLNGAVDGHEFILRAYTNHGERIGAEWVLAARDTNDDIEAEEQQREP